MTEENIDYAYTDGTVTFSVNLGVNDVYFIRIRAAA
jgi:hypothetical protein